jgi:superfamily I DNA/RNA helicase
VLYLPAQGHVAVLGTAGSGKTMMAIHRAAYLAHPRTDHHGRTLLVTFNRALVTYLQHLGGSISGSVTVEHYHKFARGYLSSRGQIGWGQICDDQERVDLIRSAIIQMSAEHPDDPLFSQTHEFLADEISWIARHGIRRYSEYSHAESVGYFGARAPHGNRRELIWRIYQQYYVNRRAVGKRYDWDDVAYAVYHQLSGDIRPRLYRHVVIDEGQDFSPIMIRSLVTAVPSDGSVTFFGDVAQQIYGSRMSWRSAGLEIEKPWIFRENYRNTQQIARLALAIAQMPYFRDVPDLVEPVAPAAAGPLPTLVSCRSLSEEIQLVVNQAGEAARTQSVAILFRRRADERLLPEPFRNRAIRLHGDMPSWHAGAGVRYGTYHAAKGMEFDVVILPLFGQEHLPSSEEIDTFGEEEASVRDGRLVYVGVTRARTRLIMTYTGQVTPLLPTSGALYTQVSL